MEEKDMVHVGFTIFINIMMFLVIQSLISCFWLWILWDKPIAALIAILTTNTLIVSITCYLCNNK